MTTTPATYPLAETADGAELTLTGRITGSDPQTTGQGNPWAIITLATDLGELAIRVFPRHYAEHQQLLRDGNTITVDVRVSQYGRTPTVGVFGIRASDGGQ